MNKIYPEISEIRPFYWIEQADGTIKYYSILEDIANDYCTSVVNIKRQIDGDNVKKLDGIKINKEKYPYVITYKDKIYECRTLAEAKNYTGTSVTKIHNLIKEYLQKRS